VGEDIKQSGDPSSVESQGSSCRDQFEQWVSDDPYARSVERWPDEPEKFAWPGTYKDINTDLAWQAWQTAWELGDKCRDGCKIKRWVKEAQDSLTTDYTAVENGGQTCDMKQGPCSCGAWH